MNVFLNQGKEGDDYRLVITARGATSLFAGAYGEVNHPGIGPADEAEELYVRQLRLKERLQAHRGEWVVWDVGLGSAANALAVLRATHHIPGELRLVSFDKTLGMLGFALDHASQLGYASEDLPILKELIEVHRVERKEGSRKFLWEFHLGDFPSLLNSSRARSIPAPHAILFDAFSPATNPAMWTGSLFANLYRCLDPRQSCALATYSRSTSLRVALLLAGFYVGPGSATGEKEETTLASNDPALLQEAFGIKFLERVRKSDSAEPLWEPIYRQAPIRPETMARLQKHPQFV